MEQLASLARDLQAVESSLVVDLVFNHTSDEHLWAEKAKAGEKDFGYVLVSRTAACRARRSALLREIFPTSTLGRFAFPGREVVGSGLRSTNTSGT
jgi:amylosucrase